MNYWNIARNLILCKTVSAPKLDLKAELGEPKMFLVNIEILEYFYKNCTGRFEIRIQSFYSLHSGLGNMTVNVVFKIAQGKIV